MIPTHKFFNFSAARHKPCQVFVHYLQFINQSRLSDGYIKWQMLLHHGIDICFVRRKHHLSTCFASLPDALPASANLMPDTKLITFLCKLMLICPYFLCQFKSTNALAALHTGNQRVIFIVCIFLTKVN